MADIADLAGEAIEACIEDAQRRALGRSAPETHPDFDGEHCIEPECGVVIPTGRLALGRVRCVECQHLIERKARR